MPEKFPFVTEAKIQPDFQRHHLLAAWSEQKREQVFLVSSQTPPSGEVQGLPQVKEADRNLYFLCSGRKSTDIVSLKLWLGTNSSGKECWQYHPFQHVSNEGNLCSSHFAQEYFKLQLELGSRALEGQFGCGLTNTKRLGIKHRFPQALELLLPCPALYCYWHK